VVLDSNLHTPENARLLGIVSTAPTWIFHADDAPHDRRDALVRHGAELIAVPRGERGLDLTAVLRELARRDVMRLLVEGGPTLHGALLDAGLADRAAVFVAPRLLGDAAALPLSIGRPRERMLEALTLRDVTRRSFGDDTLIEGAL
jgi:diaminohydroxyphosphoribosylaminopyrimidine deaminase/5-amino-6-(5-phosphoribosylamino)uracil reductase